MKRLSKPINSANPLSESLSKQIINSVKTTKILDTPPVSRPEVLHDSQSKKTILPNNRVFLSAASKNTSFKNIKSTVKSEFLSLKQQETYLSCLNNNNTVSGQSTQIKVISRFRPMNNVEEKDAGSICVEFLNSNTVSIVSQFTPKTDFTLDAIFSSEVSQEQFYKEVISETITDTLNGYNGTVFTYGQSGSGKTYTMLGVDLTNSDLKGIIPRAIDQIFDTIDNENNNNLFEIKLSILQIYKEKLYDMLNPSVKYTDLKIKEDPKLGTYVQNLTTVSVEDKDEVYALIEHAEEYRTVAETKLNKASSRSHFVFMLYINQKLPDDTEKLGILNLVDLAGSEKVSKTGAIGETLEEAKKINSSLSALGNVIHSLSSGNSDFVGYRDSKLTRLLKDSLGGNFKTTLIVTCSPHSYNVDETLSTLNFAKRAKKVKNRVKVNIKRSPQELEKIIERLTENITRLNEENIRLKLGANSEINQSGSKELLSSKTEAKFLYSRFNTDNEKIASATVIYNAFDKDYYEKIIREKDEEIMRLKDDVESLTNEKNDILKEVKNLKKVINLDKTIEVLEKSIKSNISSVEEVFYRYKNDIESLYQEENIKLKEKIKEKEISTLKSLEKIMEKDFKFVI